MNGEFQILLKRLFDIIVSLISLVLLAPMLFLIALIIKLTSKGSIFYRWRIIGQGEKPVIGYKFRTMVPDAEEIEGKFRNEGRNQMNRVYFKLKQDPRVSKIGKSLRKFSIDEFPELYSVVKGDISLVGPRPVRLHEYRELKD